MSNDTQLEGLLDFACKVAREAGQITLKYFKQPFSPDRKSDGSFVTVADRETERFIRARIEEAFPDDAIFGEEESPRAGRSGRQWIIDPIDGTFSFVHGVPFYGVMIGLEINVRQSGLEADQDAVLGVVNLPALGEMVYAARGVGCYWNDARARVSQTEKLEDALLLSTDFGVCERYGFGVAAESLQRRANARRTWGDCYGHVLVATGRAEVMLDPVMNVWDCAPFLPILEEAGGTFTDWKGRKTIRGGNAISTNGALFEEVMKTVMSNE